MTRGFLLFCWAASLLSFVAAEPRCPAVSVSLLQVVETKPVPRKTKRLQSSEDATAQVDAASLREALRSVTFDPNRRQRQLRLFALCIAFTLLSVALLCRALRWFLSPKGADGSWTLTVSALQPIDSGRVTVPLDVDVYGAAVSSCVRDTGMLTRGSRRKGDESIRAFRVLASLITLWSLIAIQGFISYMVATQASKVVVLKFRRLYDRFELAVYKDTRLSDGFHRGTPSAFHPEGFADLTSLQMNTICQMPFANDLFLVIIIFVWTLSCVVDLRRAVGLFVDITVMMPRAATLSAATEDEGSDEEPEVTIVGIPVGMKFFLAVTILIPRILLDVVVLVLGCRWLVATSDMADLILNSMALEFILLLNSMVLQALVPAHGINGLSRTKMISSSSRQSSALLALSATLSWASLSVIWCISYVYLLQDVLPGYLWDVRGVCDVWRTVVSQES
mmetsp:Transcript_14656/g.27530  ORF Transcript_14656/g.27530 Transcript_14656/m.27530 type:complete len:450 (+) Transcript_14656:59-1408(+)